MSTNTARIAWLHVYSVGLRCSHDRTVSRQCVTSVGSVFMSSVQSSFFGSPSGGRLPIADSPEGLLHRRSVLVDRIQWHYNYIIDNGGTRYDANQVLENSIDYNELKLINLRLGVKL